jgi:hypothetical protein
MPLHQLDEPSSVMTVSTFTSPGPAGAPAAPGSAMSAFGVVLLDEAGACASALQAVSDLGSSGDSLEAGLAAAREAMARGCGRRRRARRGDAVPGALGDDGRCGFPWPSGPERTLSLRSIQILRDRASSSPDRASRHDHERASRLDAMYLA